MESNSLADSRTPDGHLHVIADHLKISSAISEFEMSVGDDEMSSYRDDKDAHGLIHIVKALQTNSSLTRLRLTYIDLRYTEDIGRALIEMLQVNKSLTHFELLLNKSFSRGTRCIFEGLRYNTSLVDLHLRVRESGITDTDPATAKSFFNMLKMNKSLTYLDLSDYESFSLDAFYIFEGLRYNTSLVNLKLCNTGITAADPDRTAASLIKMLQVNKSLTHLDLSECESLSLGAHCIFEGLQHNTSLVNLNLCCPSITTTDPYRTATSIIKMLQVNKSLTDLDLSQINLCLQVRCIFEGLQYNTSLISLNLFCTSLTVTDPDTVKSFTKMIQVNKSLKYLDLTYNDFPESICRSIMESLQYNTSNLIDLDLSDGCSPHRMKCEVRNCLITY